MYLPESMNDFPEGPPPPVPPRNPLRNDPYRVQKLGLLSYKDIDDVLTSHGRPTLDMIAESSRETVDAYPDLASSRRANREFTLDDFGVLPTPHPDRAAHRLSFMSLSDGEDDASMVSRRSSWTNGLRRFSSLRERCTPSMAQSSGVSFKKQSDIKQAMARLQGKLVDADADDESLTTISSYDGESRFENTTRNDGENSRVEAWLQRGTMDAQSVTSTHTSHTDNARKPPSAKRSPALSIFPPTSPKTGKREYTCPSSPMNNGRDAYGNYIPTNTNDYVTARTIPSSQKSRSDVEDTQSCGQKSTSTTRLRGGGGWWNALGIGLDATESPERKQAEVATSEASHQRTPAQSLRVKRPVGSASQYSASLLSDGGDSYAGRSLVGHMANPASLQQTRPAQFGDHDVIASISSRRSDKQSMTARLTSQHLSSRTYANNDHVTISPQQRPTPSHADAKSHAGSVYKPPSTNYSKTSMKIESPWPGVTYNPRPIKKWNQEPASGPPSLVAMPPPPLLRRTHTDTEVASSVGVINPSKYRYDRTPSPAESYDDQAWDLQSLQLGESVSVVGGPRRTLGAAIRSRNVPFSPEEFDAAQKRAQVEFHPLCQTVMTRHNGVMAGFERELKDGSITKEQYDIQIRFQMQNMEKSLKYSAEKSGYMILTSEFSILESLTSPDSYAIYHDLLSTTKPELWKSLVQQHHNLMAQNMKPTASSTASTASRTSSLDTAKHVAGKIARFVLAVPDDPDLKTVSMRKNKIEGLGQEDGDINVSTTKDKAKEKSKHPIMSPRTETHDFATLAGHSRITGTTAVNPTTTTTANDERRSNSTARTTTSSEQSQLIQARIQATYKPITTFPGHRESPPPKRQSPRRPTSSDVLGTDVSQQSMWPQGDSQNNWWIPKGRLGLRGGKGKEGKKKEKKEKKAKEVKEKGTGKKREGRDVWLEALRAEAMYVHGI